MMKRNHLKGKQHFRYSKQLSAALALSILLGTSSWLNAQTLIWIGNPPQSLGNSTWAYDVSWDGRVVVGTHGLDMPPSLEAFYWTPNSGMVGLGFLVCCAGSGAHGVSPDGGVIVGWSWNGEGYRRAFRWSQQTGMVDLGTLPGGNESWAYDVSRGGLWIVGWSTDWRGNRRIAVRWRWPDPPQILPLGIVSASTESLAYRVSADGRIIAGARIDSGQSMAICWEEGNAGWTIHTLGTLGGSGSEALGVSADGRVVVGWAHNSSNRRRAFLWGVGDNLPVRDLGTLPGDKESWANDVSNGTSMMDRVIVGTSYGGGGKRAVRWSNLGPLPVLEDLNVTYACLLTDGSRLKEATAVSPDGRYIVGWGYDASRGFQAGFLLDTQCSSHNGDVNNDGCVDDADLLAILFAFGQHGECLGRVDVNCDGVVDDADLLVALFNFGTGC